jgi:DNA-binding CsgD family transcriptional regulator
MTTCSPADLIAPALTPKSWRDNEDRLAEELTAMHNAAAQALGGEQNVGVLSRVLAGDFTGAVAAFTAWCIAHVTSPSLPQPADLEVRAILRELRRLGAAAAEHDLGLHARRLLDTSAALRRLNATATSAQLVDLACEQLVSKCGFGRAVLSRVDVSSWRPWMAHFVGTDVDSSWFADWVDRPVPLDDLVVEAQVLDARRPALVPDTDESRVYRPIIVDAGRSSSYVVAPVVLGNEVVGFFHADHAPAEQVSGLIDRDVLCTFAQGFGLAYEKLVLAERVQAQRERLQAALGSAESLIASSAPSLELAADTDPSSRLLTADDTIPEQGACRGLLEDEELTGREREVLRLLAVGATNAQIADELVVSENTVKSHVRHILRKLRAVNRAQAISRYLGVSTLAG